MSKTFWGVLVGIVVVLIGIFVLTGNKAENTSTIGATNHVMGSGSTGVKLVEYGDYQCPYCQAYYTTVKQAVAQYEDKLTFQFVNFPIPSIHQNAFAASRAAEAAAKQNKFWEMHDLLYQTNDPSGSQGWVASKAPSKYFEQYATKLGLNLAQFKKDYASSAINSAVNADMAKGNKAGVEGTPTFFLDGKKVTLSNSVADFTKVLDQAIKNKNAATQQ